jgi:Tfp pilus assembly protein PilO
VLITASILVFVFLTEPVLNADKQILETGDISGGIVALRQEKQVLSEALNDARELKERTSILEDQYSQISDSELKRLDVFLPSSPNELQMIVDINRIASMAGMKIADVKVKDEVARRPGQSKDSNLPSGVEPLTLSFSVTGDYRQLVTFISDISKNLRLVDVIGLSFALPTANEPGTQPKYNFEIKTYWLK